MLHINYPNLLEFKLSPDETTGEKRINVQGFTEFTKTEYWIKVELINKEDGKILDQKIEKITVKK